MNKLAPMLSVVLVMSSLVIGGCSSQKFDDLLQTSGEMRAYSAGCANQDARSCDYYFAAAKRFHAQEQQKLRMVGDTMAIAPCPSDCKMAFANRAAAQTNIYRALVVAAYGSGANVEAALVSKSAFDALVRTPRQPVAKNSARAPVYKVQLQ